MHSHQFYEINIIMCGRGRHYIADISLSAETGDVFVIPPGFPHGYFAEKKLDICHILLKKSFIRRYYDELVQFPGYDLFFDIEPLIRSSSGEAFNLNVGAEYCEIADSKTDEMIRAEQSGLYMYENVLVLEFIAELCKKMKNKVENNDWRKTEIIGIMEFIKKNLNYGITLPEIAAYANMSPATLNRRFKSMTGISPMQFALKCRVQTAQKLIEQNKYTKTEIAQQCGFYDLAHLNKYLGNKN